MDVAVIKQVWLMSKSPKKYGDNDKNHISNRQPVGESFQPSHSGSPLAVVPKGTSDVRRQMWVPNSVGTDFVPLFHQLSWFARQVLSDEEVIVRCVGCI
jgi:hypothetical protein